MICSTSFRLIYQCRYKRGKEKKVSWSNRIFWNSSHSAEEFLHPKWIATKRRWLSMRQKRYLIYDSSLCNETSNSRLSFCPQKNCYACMQLRLCYVKLPVHFSNRNEKKCFFLLRRYKDVTGCLCVADSTINHR